MKAWVLTWDWTGEAAATRIDRDLTVVLNARLPWSAVRAVAETIYGLASFTLEERIEYAKRGRFYKLLSGSLLAVHYSEQLPGGVEFRFGRDPCVYARLVDDVHAELRHALPERT